MERWAIHSTVRTAGLNAERSNRLFRAVSFAPMRLHRLLSVATGVAVAMAIAGCASDNYPVVDVRNDSGEPVRVVMRYAGGDVVVTENLPPGLSYPHSEMGKCDDATLIAFDADGVEIARKEGPICRPSTWVIPPASAPAPS